MKIGSRLLLGFAVLVVSIIAVILFGINGLISLNKEVDLLANDRFPKTVWANNIIDAVNEVAIANKNLLISFSPEEIQKNKKRLENASVKVNENFEKLEETIKSEKGKELLQNIHNTRMNVFYPPWKKMLDEIEAGNFEAASEVMYGDYVPAERSYVKSITDLIDYQNELVNISGTKAIEEYHNARNLMYAIGAIGVILAIIIALWLIKSITAPLNRAVEAANSIAKGKMNVNLETDKKDETAVLLNAMKQMANNIKGLVKELNQTAEHAVAGRLDNRADADAFEGEYKTIMQGFNKTLDAVIGPLNVTAEYVDRISKGDIPPKITDTYHGDFNEIKNNLNNQIDVMKGMLNETNNLIKAAKAGQLDTRADSSQFVGDWGSLVGGVNELVDAMVAPLNVTAEYVDRISKGDIPPKITDTYHGDFNEIKNNLNNQIDVMAGLLDETNTLIKAAKMGQLDTRADSAKFVGDWGSLVGGVNELVDAMVAPLNVTAEYVDRISKGDIPPKITDTYHGDFNEIKNNLNNQIDVMKGLLDETNTLIKAAKAGQLDTRADSSQFVGDWGSLVGGVNELVDAMVAPLNVTAEYVDRISKGDIPPKITDTYHGDFNEIKNNLNNQIDVMRGLLDETNTLIKAAKAGQLDTRADSSKFVGDWGNLVGGVNELVDAMVAPLNVTAEYIDRISKGDMPPEITDTYHGDFNEIKNNLNQLISNLNDFINEMNHMSKEHDLGDIDVVIDTNKFTGFYSDMAVGVNDMVNGHINVKKMAMGVFKEYGKGNFDKNIEKLPGKKAFINETIDAVQDNLKMVAQEIKDLIKKSVAGELSYRGDESKYDGDWKEMVAGINEMIDALLEPVNEAGQVLEIMATGDLRTRMKGNYNGENENLKKNINLLGDSLSNLILQVNQNVETSASSATEISATSESLAASTQEQSAQADEVASAVEEMSRTITENAMSANKTSEVAQNNGEVAKNGATVVEQTVKKMRDIATVVKDSAGNIEKLGDSSKKIGEIISVIDDIADQTNLLALNAAIEAARAGEQGRGFAVVADEVRKLAERTTEATKQIASMIKGIQSETESAVLAMNQGTTEVNSGIELADKAGESLNSILSSTQEVMDMINQIAAASEQQSATSEQISKNVVSISKVTSESAQRVEDVSKTADDLARLTENLSNLMKQFKVEDVENALNQDLQISSSRGDSRHLPAPDEQ